MHADMKTHVSQANRCRETRIPTSLLQTVNHIRCQPCTVALLICKKRVSIQVYTCTFMSYMRTCIHMCLYMCSLGMCMCMCMCMYDVCAQVYILVYVVLYACVCVICGYARVCMRMYIHDACCFCVKGMFQRPYVWMIMYVFHKYAHTKHIHIHNEYMYKHTCTYVYMCTHTHMHIHTHIRMYTHTPSKKVLPHL
jgi:hypothetical protein